MLGNVAHPKIFRAKNGFGLLPFTLLSVVVLALALIFAKFTIIPQTTKGLGMLLYRGELGQVLSPAAGIVTSWLKEEGDDISKGEVLALLLNHENQPKIEVRAVEDGVIAEIIAYGNTWVEKGQPLAIIAHRGDPRADLELIGFVSSLDGKKIRPGMTAMVDPTITSPYLHGHLVAKVKRVGKLPMTKAAILSLLKIPEVAKYIRSQIEAEPFVVVLQLEKNDQGITGYQWTGPGPEFPLDSGVFAQINITHREETLFDMLWPSLAQWPRESWQ